MRFVCRFLFAGRGGVTRVLQYVEERAHAVGKVHFYAHGEISVTVVGRVRAARRIVYGVRLPVVLS